MRKWNKKFGLAILSLGLLSMSPSAASAQGCYNDSCCNPCENMCGGMKVGVDFLWWKPSVEDLDFAKSSTYDYSSNRTDVYHHHKTLCHDWEPGVRLWVSKPDIWCNWELLARYEWIETNHSASVHNANGVCGALTHPDFDGTFDNAWGKHKLTYQTFDVLLGYPIEFCQCQSLTPYFGLTGLFIDQNLKSELWNGLNGSSVSDEFVDSSWNSNFWAIGFKFGTSYDYPICDGLSVIALGEGMLVTGKADNSQSSGRVLNFGTVDTERHHFKDNECYHIYPGFHFAIGAGYETCYCDWEIGARIGYEFVQWIHLPNERRFFRDGDCAGGSSSPSNRNLGFQGLFAGVDIKF